MRTITIQHKNLLNFKRSTIKITGCIAIALLTLFSCRSSDVEGTLTPAGQASVSINIKDATFEGTGVLGNKASTGNTTLTTGPLQQSTVAFNDDFYLLAELTQDVNTATSSVAKASSSQPNKAAADTTLVKPNIRYKIIAYDQNGLYVAEKDYTRGSESTAGAFMLDGGKTYSFIIYSINSTSTLPAVTFANTANKTLATSSVNIGGNDDFMYYRKNMTVSGTANNYLDVVLQHKLSQITTTIDASQSGYNVTSVTSHFTPHNSTATVNLTDGSIARTGTVGNSAVTFTSPNALIVTSVPTIINANANNTTSYTIDNITIGPLTQSNITPFTNLNITPGVKYNMKLTIVPNDEYLTHAGLPAVRINGAIWMRHNVGVDTNLDPDQNPLTSAIHGNYYQWGRSAIVAGPTANSTNGNWIRNSTAYAAWNGGTEAIPIKTASDPCPTGYKIPTLTQVQKLLNDVVASNQGNFTGSVTNYSSAKILTSKRKSNVKLTLPAQGYSNVSGSEFNNLASVNIGNTRGQLGTYYLSSYSGSTVYRLDFTNNSINTGGGSGYGSRSQSRNIRCIAE